MIKNVAANRIRELREDSQLYQRQVAEYLGCSQQTYSRYETGELQLSIVSLARLSEFYDTSADYIIGCTEDKRPYRRPGK